MLRGAPQLIALTRAVSPSIADCELTHLSREPIDVERATAQHRAYEAVLRSLGATVVQVAPAPALPDAVFIEDTAIVLPEIAIITRPGAVVRREEVGPVAAMLAEFRPLGVLDAPATLDGGDALVVGRTIHVGRSSRTNDAGIKQLGRLVETFGYRVVGVDFTECLHLKSAATCVADGVVLVNPAWVSASVFEGCEAIEVDATEPYAANGARVGDVLMYADHSPRTRAILEARGVNVVTVPCDELAKAEGAVTCCSLLFTIHSESLSTHESIV